MANGSQAPERLVPVRSPDGELGTVPASQVQANLDAGGELATQEDLHRAELQAEYGGLGGGATAFGLGALRGASFGLSDVAIAGIGGEGARKKLSGYEEANPYLSLGGELAGVVAPALLTGGEGAIATGAKVLNAPARLVGAAGRGAEAAAARVVGREAGSVLGRVGQRALTSAVGTAVEGAAYGVGHEISDAAIHDHELTAEKLWAGAGKGALIGGALGAAAGTVGQLGREAVGALKSTKTVSAWLEQQSLESTGRAAGVNKAIARKAERYGDFDAMRRTWRDEAPALVGKRNMATMTRDDLAAAAELGVTREGDRIGSTLADADARLMAKKGGEAFPKALDVIDDLERAAGRVESQKLGGRGFANQLRDLADHARQMTGLVDANGQYVAGAAESRWTLQNIHDFRVTVDKAIGSFPTELKGFKAELADVRRVLEDRVVAGVEEAGGVGLKRTYETAKQKYQAWKTLGDATKNASAGSASNRFFGLSEHIGGGTAAIVGGVMGSALGPVGTAIGAMAGKAVGAGAAHLLRTRGDFVASSLLSHVAQLGAIERATAMVDQRIGSSVRAFMAKGAQAAASPPKVASDDRDQKRALRVAQVVTNLASDDDARTARIGAQVGGFGQYAPNVATHAALKAHQAIFNLAQMAPKPMHPSNSFTLDQEKVHYNKSQVYDFSRYLEGYEEPLSVLEDMRKGRLDPLKLQAVQENHPRLYSEMRERLWDSILGHGKPLTWDQKKVATLFFGLPADDTLEPGFVQRMQQSAAQAAPEPNSAASAPQQQMGGRRPIELEPAMYMSPTEAINTPI